MCERWRLSHIRPFSRAGNSCVHLDVVDWGMLRWFMSELNNRDHGEKHHAGLHGRYLELLRWLDQRQRAGRG